MSSEHHLRELEEKYEDYKVYDRNGEKIGKVDDLFIDETDREEYIGVKMGFFGLKSTLIPMEVVRVNEADRRVEVSETKDMVKGAPTFSDDDEIDASFEENIRRHFHLESGGSSGDRGSYGAHPGASSGTSTEQSRDRTDEQSERSVDEPGSRESHDTDGQREGFAGSSSGTSGTASSDTSSSGSGREVYTTEADRDVSRGADDQPSGSVGEADSGEYRETQGAGNEEASHEGSTESTQEEGGRPRVRRRIVTEEIIEEPPDSQR